MAICLISTCTSPSQPLFVHTFVDRYSYKYIRLHSLGVAASSLGLKRHTRGPEALSMLSTLDHSIFFYSYVAPTSYGNEDHQNAKNIDCTDNRNDFDCNDWVLYVVRASSLPFSSIYTQHRSVSSGNITCCRFRKRFCHRQGRCLNQDPCVYPLMIAVADVFEKRDSHSGYYSGRRDPGRHSTSTKREPASQVMRMHKNIL